MTIKLSSAYEKRIIREMSQEGFDSAMRMLETAVCSVYGDRYDKQIVHAICADLASECCNKSINSMREFDLVREKFNKTMEECNAILTNLNNLSQWNIITSDVTNSASGSINHAKPPIGLIPKKDHDRARKNEIIEAMKRYTDVGKAIPKEWVKELSGLYND